MSARQTKKRKGRPNNRERTVTTFTQDPNTSFLVPLPSEDPPSSFSMPYQNYIYQPTLPPGKNDLDILENLKSIIKEGQHEFYRAVPQPAALASLYMGHIPPPHDYPRFNLEPPTDTPNGLDTIPNVLFSPSPSPTLTLPQTVEALTSDTSPPTLAADGPDSSLPSAQPEPEDTTAQGPVDTKTDTPGEYAIVDTAPPDKETTKVEEPPQENAWERQSLEDRHDRKPIPQPQLQNGDPQDDSRSYDRDRDLSDRDRDRDRHDSIRDRDTRDRRPEFFGRSYGRSHAPRPPPELRHYEPSYGDDYAPPPRRYDPDDRRGGFRNPSYDDRPRPPPFNDRRPPFDDRRLDDRPIRRLPAPDSRPLPPNTEDRTRSVSDSIPLSRTTAEDDRNARASSLAADDRPRLLEERLSQPAPPLSLQDRLSQPVSAPRVDIAPAPSLEERLSSAPVPPRTYVRAASVARDDLHAPPSNKDDLRDHDRLRDFRTSRAFSRERGGPPLTASTYRPDVDRSFGNRDDRDRRDRDVVDVDTPPARFGDTFNRGPPPRRYSPPPVLDRDRERDRGRPYYPPLRSPPPFRSEGVYDPDGERRCVTDRERDAYEQRRRDWDAPGDDGKRGPPPPPPPASWRSHDRPPFLDRDRERFDRERERDRDFRERDRERDRDRELGNLVPPPAPTRAHWEDRDRRLPLSPPHSRMDTAGGPARSLSARLTDPYPPPPGGDDRTYPPLRDFDRGRYGGPPMDDHAHGPPFSRVRNRSPSPPRRGLADNLRPPLKRMRDDSGTGYAGAAYSPPRRGGVGGGGEYTSGPPPSSTATATTTTTTAVTSLSGTVAARSTGTRTPPLPLPNNSGTGGGAFYERDPRDRDREREREREREYVRGEYGMGYERDDRGRRSPPPMMGRMGPGGAYGRRDDRRYVPPRAG